MIAPLFAAIATAAAVASTPAAIVSPPAVRWQGVTLGESVTAVVARFGLPASRRKSIMGTYLLEYKTVGGGTTLSLTDGGGVITGIRLVAADPSSVRPPVADPFGIELGDSADRLTELRGQPQRYDDEGDGDFTSYYGRPSDARWTYGLRNGLVISIGVVAAYRVVRVSGAVVSVPTPRPSDSPPPPPRDASGLDRAVRVTTEDRDADPQFEFDYVRHVACGAGDRWTPSSETFINALRRNFSRVDALCASTGGERSFYFDITAVFGRAER